MVYYVKLRDVLTGAEHWLDGSDGQHFTSSSRQIADCMALAMSRFGSTELAYVVEIDPRFECVS